VGADDGPTEAPVIERTAPPEEPAWPSHPALQGEGMSAGGDERGEHEELGERAGGGPILRDARSREGASGPRTAQMRAGEMGARRRGGSAGSEGEVQVGRGPLALHLSRAATEERLAESEERLAKSDKRLTEARRELEDHDSRLSATRERLTQTSERLSQAEKRVAALEERLLMTEESERHALEQQARAEESRETLVAQLSAIELREGELKEGQESERTARARVQAELERLRGSFATLAPLVHALHEATGEIQAVLAQDPEAGVAHGGGQSGDADGGGGVAQAPSAAADPSASGAAEQESNEPLPPPDAERVEHGEAGLLGALVDVVERWRSHAGGH
jgi:hypothetical protein